MEDFKKTVIDRPHTVINSLGLWSFVAGPLPAILYVFTFTVRPYNSLARPILPTNR